MMASIGRSRSAGAIVMLATIDVTLNDAGFKTALIRVGAGAGLLASQLGNVIMSSVEPSRTSALWFTRRLPRSALAPEPSALEPEPLVAA
jgi:hypothetical protein